ncbi:hypothetical protein OKW37_003200 [Paraburkholderia sp. MM5482-R2]
MSLVDDIIAALSSQDHSLVDALLKTKVLLHDIGHKELVPWVNNEINGYPPDAELPAYRLLSSQVLGNVAGMTVQYTAHPLPIGHLTEEQRAQIQTARMTQSLAVLEKFAEGEGGRLEAPIPLEANGLLGKTLAHGLVIQRAWCQISQAELPQIFVQVRSRLLDFVLELRDRLGESNTTEKIKEAALDVDAPGLFRSAIFGDNTTIVLGSNNSTHIAITNGKGDFDALATALRSRGMEEPDIVDLKNAVAADEGAEEASDGKPGPAVKGWLGRVVAKTMDGTWAISTAVASATISEALKNYFGWH